MAVLGPIDPYSETPIYEQLENKVQFAIASGELKSGARLPTIRVISEQYKINPNTAAKAYRDLEVMGIVYTRRGDGIFVKENARDECIRRCHSRILERIYFLSQEAKAAGILKGKLQKIVLRGYQFPEKLYGELPPEVIKLIEA